MGSNDGPRLGSVGWTLVTAVVAATALPVLGNLGMKLSDYLGLTSDPMVAGLGTSLRALLGMVLNVWLYLCAVVAASLVAFLVVNGRQRRRAELEELSKDLGVLRDKLVEFRLSIEEGRLGSNRPMDHLMHLAQDFESVLTSLFKRGLSVPRLDPKVDPLGYVEVGIRYADRIEPLLRRRHFHEAEVASHEEFRASLSYQASRIAQKAPGEAPKVHA